MAKRKSEIKVLLFSPYFWPYISGLTQYPYRFLTEHSFNITSTCLTFKHKKELRDYEVISPRCNIIRMPYLFRISKGFISPQSWCIFWSQLIKHDMVLLNLPSVEGVILALFARIVNKPVISILHCEVLLPPGVVNRIINCILNAVVFIQLVLSKKIIVYTKDYYADKPMYALFRNKMEIILPSVHTVDPDLPYLAELRQMRKDKVCVGFCGRISYEKGVHILIESMKSIENSIIFFAGPYGKDVVGEEAYCKTILNTLHEAHIPFHFLGTLSGSQLSAFYKAIDVLVLPSVNKTEAFGMVQVEAMLQGTPVVASHLPGVRIPAKLSQMGQTVEPGNSAMLSDAIYHVVSNRSQFTQPKLIQKMRSLFNPHTTYQMIYNLLRDYAKQKS